MASQVESSEFGRTKLGEYPVCGNLFQWAINEPVDDCINHMLDALIHYEAEESRLYNDANSETPHLAAQILEGKTDGQLAEVCLRITNKVVEERAGVPWPGTRDAILAIPSDPEESMKLWMMCRTLHKRFGIILDLRDDYTKAKQADAAGK